jgi:hypothetical protein
MKVRNSRSNSGPRLVQLLHLGLGEHAGHQHLVLGAVHRHLHRLAAITEPLLHRRDLVLLGVDDPLGQCARGPASGGAQPAITMAWAWWPIMADMK